MVIHGDLGISIETTQGIRNALAAWPRCNPMIGGHLRSTMIQMKPREFFGNTLWLFNMFPWKITIFNR